MADQEFSNRRQEQRMPLHNLDLKIRKLGLSRSLHKYEFCQSIDLSFNGLAFASDTLQLEVPEKVDFLLTIEGQQMKGIGVTCNRRQTSSGTEYGLMFLNVEPEISSVFNANKFSTQELESLAKKQAEHFVYSFIKNNVMQDALILSKQQQMFDACRVYLIRLGEMGIRIVGSNSDQLVIPIQAVKIFKDSDKKLVLRWHNLKTTNPELCVIQIENDRIDSSFVIDDIHRFTTAIQVLDYLGKQLEPYIRFI